MDFTISPGKLRGAVTPPPSKSIAHRAILCAAMAKGVSLIENVAFSQDITATIEAVKQMGAKVEMEGDRLRVDGSHMFSKDRLELDCNESGSTLRFLIPITLCRPVKAHFTGRGLLGSRPLDPFYPLFEQDGITWEKGGSPLLNFSVEGALAGGEYEIPGNVSSQFITGLLFALPLLEKDSVITVTTPMESVGYIDLTLEALKAFGIHIMHDNYRVYRIPGNQAYVPCDFAIEPDFSQAAFYLCAAALGNSVEVRHMNRESLQGDRAVLDCLEKLGCTVIQREEGISVETDGLKGTCIDGSQFPDIVPVLSVVCALAKGESQLINIGRLRIKECDRLHVMADHLARLGACVEEREDSLVIKGVESFTGGIVDSFNDHRIAMSMAVASTRCMQDLIVKDANCVKKSYPDFWEDIKRLGGRVE